MSSFKKLTLVLGSLPLRLIFARFCHFVPVLFAFVAFFSVLRQYIGWEERLRNDVYCVELDVKP